MLDQGSYILFSCLVSILPLVSYPHSEKVVRSTWYSERRIGAECFCMFSNYNHGFR
jgi:hypothetical protein